MLDIYVNARRTLALKEAISDAVESGQYDSLSQDIRDCFTDEQVEQIEELLDTGDLEESIDNVLSDWSGDNVEELLTDLKEMMGESGIALEFDELGDIDDDDFEEEEEEYADEEEEEGDFSDSLEEDDEDL